MSGGLPLLDEDDPLHLVRQVVDVVQPRPDDVERHVGDVLGVLRPHGRPPLQRDEELLLDPLQGRHGGGQHGEQDDERKGAVVLHQGADLPGHAAKHLHLLGSVEDSADI